MPTHLTGDYVAWNTRITLRRVIEEQIRALAHEEARSYATMIGVLLTEAITARSST